MTKYTGPWGDLDIVAIINERRAAGYYKPKPDALDGFSDGFKLAALRGGGMVSRDDLEFELDYGQEICK